MVQGLPENPRKLKICIIMHKLCKLRIFKKCLEITFVGMSDVSEHFYYFTYNFFRDFFSIIHKIWKNAFFQKCQKQLLLAFQMILIIFNFFSPTIFQDKNLSIMHKICIFPKCLKTTFVGISDDSEQFIFIFHLQFFRDFEKFVNF